MDQANRHFCCRVVMNNYPGPIAKNIMLKMDRGCRIEDLRTALLNEWECYKFPSELYWKDADGDQFYIKNEHDFVCFKQIGNNKVFAVFPQ